MYFNLLSLYYYISSTIIIFQFDKKKLIFQAKKENIEQQHQKSEKKPAVPNFTKNPPIFDHPRPKIETLSSEFINELKDEHDIEYEKIDIYKSEENGKLNWHCPEQSCSRIFPKSSQLKLHIFSHRSRQASNDGL